MDTERLVPASEKVFGRRLNELRPSSQRPTVGVVGGLCGALLVLCTEEDVLGFWLDLLFTDIMLMLFELPLFMNADDRLLLF